MYLNILDPGQTVKFVTPVYKEEELVRTGVLADGSCLLHAILHASSLKYRNANIQKRNIMVSDFRDTLADSITKDQWLSFNKGQLSKIGFSIEYRKAIDELYDNMDDEILLFFKTVIHKKDVEDIFESSVNRDNLYMCSYDIIDKINKLFNNRLKSSISKYKDKILSVCEYSTDYFENMFITSMDNALEIFKSSIRDNSQWLGEEHIELVSSIFKFNLYFLVSSTKKPYTFGKNMKYPYDKNLILLWIDDSHFEIIGKVEDKKITRLFNNDDNIMNIFK